MIGYFKHKKGLKTVPKGLKIGENTKKPATSDSTYDLQFPFDIQLKTKK